MKRNYEQARKELDNYATHIKFPRDIITIQIKEKNGFYVKAPAETVCAVRVPSVSYAGTSHATHIRFIDLRTGDRRNIPLKWIDRITDIDGKDITPGQVKTKWKIKDYDIEYHPVLKKYTCTCKGFQFRKHCKHIQEVKNAKD